MIGERGHDQDDRLGVVPEATRERGHDQDDRLGVISAVTRAFADATQDPHDVLDTVARRVAEALGDACAVLLASEEGTRFEPAAVFARDGAAIAEVRDALLERLDLERRSTACGVLDASEPLIVQTLASDQRSARGAWGAAPRTGGLDRRIEVQRMMIVPLRMHGRAFGRLVLARYRPGSPA